MLIIIIALSTAFVLFASITKILRPIEAALIAGTATSIFIVIHQVIQWFS